MTQTLCDATFCRSTVLAAVDVRDVSVVSVVAYARSAVATSEVTYGGSPESLVMLVSLLLLASQILQRVSGVPAVAEVHTADVIPVASGVPACCC